MTQTQIQKTTSQAVVLEEKTLFELSRPGARGTLLPALDVPAKDLKKSLGKHLRLSPARLPELSEPEVVRHYTRLSTWNYAIDLGIYPLGSCTMKHNPRFNEDIARGDLMGLAHPYDPIEWAQAQLGVMWELQEDLKAVTGLPGVSLQPAAGAHGEYTGLMVIDAYHKAKGRNRRTVITADTSHGTNPASAAMAGFQVVQIETAAGSVHPDSVAKVLTDDVACIMLTNPNTLGVFEQNVAAIVKMCREKDVLVYIDGANMNAVLGLARPGDWGADVIQFNLHKTFSTPHGGGGPGSGPIAVSEKLIPFLPVPRVEKSTEGSYNLSKDFPQSIGRVKAFYGNFGMFIRAWCYIRALGAEGLRKVSEDAILNANYIRARLSDVLNLPVDAPTLHEVVFNDRNQRESGCDTTKMAKRLLDYGMHPMTVHFPLCVKNAIMIEPTETESRAELDRFVDALREILTNTQADTPAPVRTFRTRVDETKAARELVLTYRFPG